MMIPCVEPQIWTTSEVQHQIKKLYPIRTFPRKPVYKEPVFLWYPWFMCPATIEMDTMFRSGQVHADLVAVDSVRPMRQRVEHLPESQQKEVPDSIVIKPRLTPEMASDEAFDLLTSIVINRNKLLKQHKITVREPQLCYFRIMVIPVEGYPADDWPVVEEHFGNSYRLARRRELQTTIKNLALERV